MAPHRLQLKVLSPNETLFDGQVRSVSSVNDQGRFDILGQHSRFISIIKDKLEIRDDAKQKHVFAIESGVVHCQDDDVKVYVLMNQDVVDSEGSETIRKGK